MAVNVSLAHTFAGLSGTIPLSYLDDDYVDLTAAFGSFNSFSNYLTDTGATNAYAATLGAGLTGSVTAGLLVQLLPSNSNTAASTFAFNGTTAKNIFQNGVALTGGEIKQSVPLNLLYDGTQWNIVGGAYKGLFHIGTLTRDMTATSGDVAYTGVGFKPTVLVFFSGGPSTLVGGASWGMDDGTNHKAIIAVAAAPGAFASDASHSISINESGTQAQTAIVKTLDSDGFTLTWTKTGVPSAGNNITTYLALR